MNIGKETEGKTLTLSPEGRMDAASAPELEAVLMESLEGIETLVLDLKDLEYISSAGLRVLLVAHKMMAKQGKLIVRNVNETVGDILEVTGFSDILTIE